MIKKGKIQCKQKVIVCILAAVVLVSGMIAGLIAADAAEEEVDEIVYDNSYKMANYWSDSVDGAKTAPVKDGYVFGGWYQKTDTGYTVLTESSADAYAKFVPAYVLSVKAQIQKAAENGEAESTYLRVITTVDSTDYQNVGFDIWLNNKTQVTNVPVITKVYSSLSNSEGNMNPDTSFGTASSKFAVLKLTEILSTNYQKIIYVRPYWTTLDGTKVEGLARYIRVEDGFSANQYISIPINLMEGKEVAAGIVELSYAKYKDSLEVAKDDSGNYLIDAGRLLPEMNYYVDTEAGTITFVGNADTVDENVNADGIYANVRFKLKDGVSDIEGGFLNFDVNSEKFCKWNKEAVTVDAWNIQY